MKGVFGNERQEKKETARGRREITREEIRESYKNEYNKYNKGKGNAIPLQAWTGPEGSRRLRLPDFKKSAHVDGKVDSSTHWPSLPPGNIPGIHFC
jgi:hypothetical protein